MNKIPTALAALAAAAAITLAGCHSNGSGADAKAAASSFAANPTTSAELAQGRALVASCFPGTLLQRVHTVHLVFLSSAHGRHADEVAAARDKVFGCLHISDPARRQALINDAGEAALHAHPRLTAPGGATQYFEVTLPKLILKYGGTAAGLGISTARPSIPGTTSSPSASPAASVTASGSPA